MDDIFIGRVMTTPVETLDPEVSVQSAAKQMEGEGINSVLITDTDGTLQGILTSTDIVSLVTTDDSKTSPIQDWMTTDVKTVQADQHIRDAADLLVEHDIHHLPVVDSDDHVIGILSTTDLTAYLSSVRQPSP